MANQGKKKILYIVEAMGGGVFTYIVDLANELVNYYDMYIAYALRPQTPAGYRDYFDNRINLIQVKNFDRAIDPIKDIKAFFEIRKIEREVRPDIIHLHSSKAGAIGRFAFNGKNVPLFYTPHGYSFLMENYRSGKRVIFKTVEAVCAKRSCTTISCSEGEHQESLKLTKTAAYVNNGINLIELNQLTEGMIIDKNHPFTVFTLGRICHQKNPKLFNQIAEALPEIKFIWIGDGELREQLVSSNIEITGWVIRQDALKISMNADVFLLTSLWEGLPMSLLEAMYMKKICVVNNVIGNRDVIQNGKNGFVCNSMDEFVAGIKSALDSNKGEMIKLAYQDILEKYNTAVMAQGYRKIYEKS
ncbi:glycosyltransferase [Lacrimispora indolis]|uniref:glycosyltransferase n=1 Tax=Lacrimispora indolis TaxID=69825 RepID=UPI0004A24951|nr:glycosyltransferase [Lacrimispora indolis]